MLRKQSLAVGMSAHGNCGKIDGWPPLPDETRILSGHGPETSVGEEKRENPWVGW
ncbi:MAG: hypothetical protein ABIG63_20990 [Chloroflexota bacterium]